MAICKNCKRDTRYCSCGSRRSSYDDSPVYTPSTDTSWGNNDSGGGYDSGSSGGDCGCGGCD